METQIETPLRGEAQAGDLLPFDRIRRVPASRSAGPQVMRVVIADGQALLRAGLRALLEANGRVSVVGEASTGDQALALATRTRPDVVLIDERLPGRHCAEVVSRIISEAATPVMLLTASGEDEAIFAALRAGASGVLLADTEPAELVRAVDAVARGEALLSPSITRRLIDELVSRPEPAQPDSELLSELTAREREVLALVGQGLANHEIAERLVVSPATAKTHVSRAMSKLGISNRAQLVALAYEAGLVMPSASADPRVGRAQPLTP
jgi:DNA-binding NarL/FixJ family response regulator